MTVNCFGCKEPITFCGYMPDYTERENGHPVSHFIDLDHPYCEFCASSLGLTQEFRICGHCGKPMVDGMTDLESFYAHEECFDALMDEIFPDGWRMTENEGESGAYFEAIDGGTWKDTGIFYTTWY